MEPIALIARKNLRTTPEFAALQMPKPTVSGEAFIASAKAMSDAAAVHKDTFIEHGLPATFLDSFSAAITSLSASVTDREKSYNQRLSATKGLDEKEKQGRLLLSVLDSLLEPALADNESLLRGWEGARQIRRRPGGTAAASTAPATPGVATPTVSTTTTTSTHTTSTDTPATAPAAALAPSTPTTSAPETPTTPPAPAA